MRHSFTPFRAAAAPQAPSPAAAKEAGVQADSKAASQAPSVVSQTSSNSSSYTLTAAAGSAKSKAKREPAMAHHSQATNGLSHGDSFKFRTSLHAAPAELAPGSAKHAQRDAESAGPSSTAVHLRVSTGQHTSGMAEPAPVSYASSTTSATSADDYTEVQGSRGSGEGVSTGQSTSSGWHPHDPEHLIVNGLGGAFLHPTHVFSPSRFVSGNALLHIPALPIDSPSGTPGCLQLLCIAVAPCLPSPPPPLPLLPNQPLVLVVPLSSLPPLAADFPLPEHFRSYTVSAAMLEHMVWRSAQAASIAGTLTMEYIAALISILWQNPLG